MSHSMLTGGLSSLFILWGGVGRVLTLDFLSRPLFLSQDSFPYSWGGWKEGCAVLFCQVVWDEEEATFLLTWSCL